MPWQPEPAVIVGCAAMAAAYFGWGRGISMGRGLALVAADIILLLALISPLDAIAEHLFSAHMVQHLVLLEVCGPLFVLALPPAWLQAMPTIASCERWLRRPIRAWTIGFATLALWHWPALYTAALGSDVVHAVEHLCFLISACIFWWPVLAPLRDHRMEAPTSVMYLFGRMSADLVLGCFIYAAPLGAFGNYTGYDQHLAGILMWAPTLVIDMAAAPLLLTMWASHDPTCPEEKDRVAAVVLPD